MKNLLHRAFTPGKEIDEHHDYGQDQEEVNKPAYRVTGHHPEQP
jgi:hypothetical protein